MRFLIMVKGNAASEASVMPDESLMEEMVTYHEELARAGVLLDARGLKPTAEGWRVRYSGGRPQVIDGPFTESKELIAGYTLIQCKSREEALEWSRRFPSPFGAEECEIEVRQLFECDDLPAGEARERFRELDAGAAG
jgi:hypothetical protein